MGQPASQPVLGCKRQQWASFSSSTASQTFIFSTVLCGASRVFKAKHIKLLYVLVSLAPTMLLLLYPALYKLQLQLKLVVSLGAIATVH